MSARESVVTGNFELAFPAIAKPKQTDKGEKYTITMLFESKEAMKELRRIAIAAGKEKWGDKFESMIKEKKLNWPFKDGSYEAQSGKTGEFYKMEEKYPNFKGKHFCDASTMTFPSVVDGKKQEIIDLEKEIYAGAICRAVVHAFVYTGKNSGVGLGFNALQKVADGERRGFNAASLFDEVETSSVDLDSSDEEDLDL